MKRLLGLFALSQLFACDSASLDEGTAQALLDAHIQSTSKPQVIETDVGEAVPVGQSTAHTAAWWAEYESLTNGQDRTRMLHIDATGSAVPAAVLGLRDARLAIVHGQIRDPVRTNIWWTLFTPVTEVREAVHMSGGRSRVELCTLTEQLEDVTEIHQDEPNRARVDYTSVTTAAPTAFAAPLAGVMEASSCQSTGARSRTLNFVREGDDWRIDLPKAPTKKRR